MFIELGIRMHEQIRIPTKRENTRKCQIEVTELRNSITKLENTIKG